MAVKKKQTLAPTSVEAAEAAEAVKVGPIEISLVPATVDGAKEFARTVAAEANAQLGTVPAITNNAGYELCDKQLGRVKTARTLIDARLHKIIDPIRQGLDQLYALLHEFDDPLFELEEQYKSRMKEWKTKEREKLLAEEREKQRKILEANRAAEEAQRQAQLATTKKGKAQAELNSAYAESQAAVLAMTPATEAIKGAHSSTSSIKKVTWTSKLDFVKAVGLGLIPLELIDLPSDGAVLKYWRLMPKEVADWPGVEIEDDIRISGRK